MIILSNNLWNCDGNHPAWAAKGEDCSADARVDGLVAAYVSVLPDILGFQEMSRHMEALIMRRMRRMTAPDGSPVRYELVSGGYTPILFRHDRLRLLESGHRLYPVDFPPYAGSFNDADSKGYTFGVFEERSTSRRIIVFTTHLWWKSSDPRRGSYQEGSAEARAAQIAMAMDKADALSAEYACPAVLMGDLNDRLGSPCLDAAAASGWRSAHDLCVGERSDVSGYHYCYADGWRHDPPGRYENAIDHILLKSPAPSSVTVLRFSRFTDPSFDRLSDHYPVYMEVTL